MIESDRVSLILSSTSCDMDQAIQFLSNLMFRICKMRTDLKGCEYSKIVISNVPGYNNWHYILELWN